MTKGKGEKDEFFEKTTKKEIKETANEAFAMACLPHVITNGADVGIANFVYRFYGV